jgi:hypothetical protein
MQTSRQGAKKELPCKGEPPFSGRRWHRGGLDSPVLRGVWVQEAVCRAGSTLTDRRTRPHSSKSLTLGTGTTSLVAAKRSRRDGAGAENTLQVKIVTIFAADSPRDDCEELEGGFPQRFPPPRSGLKSFASHYIHTHRRWGALVAAA